MNERERGRRGNSDRDRERLFEELWPVPTPPRDLAARVVARLATGSVPQVTTTVETDVVMTPLYRPDIGPAPFAAPAGGGRRRRALVVSSFAVAAALAALWALPRLRGSDAVDSGHLLARAPETVNIGSRAAAAAEAGSELDWSVRQQRVRVEQRRGSVLYRVRRGGPFRVVTPGGDVEVTGTSFRVTLGPAIGGAASTIVAVIEGSVQVSSGAGKRALTAGQSARLSPDRPPELMVAAPPIDPAVPAPEDLALAERPRAAVRRAGPARRGPAALMLPHRQGGSLQVYGTGLHEVSLALPAGVSAGVVEVARDPAFAQRIWRGPVPVEAGFVTVPAPARGDLYWRVAGSERSGAHARFLTERRAPGPLSHATNVVSAERESTTIYFQSAPPALTLSWNPLPAARSYRVRLTRASAPERLVFERVVFSPRCAVEAGTLGEGRHLWTVLPLDEQGRALESGPRLAARRLDLAYDNAISTLAIHAPRPGAAARGAVDVSGVAPLGARLFVNGKAAPLDDKGRFSLRLARPPRALVFRLVDKDGAESYWVRTLGRS